ncbi:hypothetical protein [Photobacterium kishitanii]|uniref:Uncharacterized protein n=1 Tax=Photobacterium kishitanii TaxID=318456 RepID=A0A2T3KL76_9GAMM|nr:hypothetical protein [Photobacterium kishitanii]PSV00409.1 hypothetical protein C9J27_04575 [Photobacterium kishitanii]
MFFDTQKDLKFVIKGELLSNFNKQSKRLSKLVGRELSAEDVLKRALTQLEDCLGVKKGQSLVVIDDKTGKVVDRF